jgi:hypothetical protein
VRAARHRGEPYHAGCEWHRKYKPMFASWIFI